MRSTKLLRQQLALLWMTYLTLENLPALKNMSLSSITSIYIHMQYIVMESSCHDLSVFLLKTMFMVTDVRGPCFTGHSQPSVSLSVCIFPLFLLHFHCDRGSSAKLSARHFTQKDCHSWLSTDKQMECQVNNLCLWKSLDMQLLNDKISWSFYLCVTLCSKYSTNRVHAV